MKNGYNVQITTLKASFIRNKFRKSREGNEFAITKIQIKKFQTRALVAGLNRRTSSQLYCARRACCRRSRMSPTASRMDGPPFL